MSNSFKKIKTIIEQEQPFGKFLLDSALYLAHRHDLHESEPLEEHIKLVNDYLSLIVESNKLDSTIDKLIEDFLKLNKFEEYQIELLGEKLKLFFCRTIIFHDLGKINPNFQGDALKMNNSKFKSKIISNYILKTHHSKLGSYIYIVKHFKDVILSGLNGKEQQICLFFILFLSYPILKHHGSKLLSIDSKTIFFDNNELEVMKSFLKNYQIELPNQLSILAADTLTEKHLVNKFFEPFKANTIIGHFPLYALTRLNFSLLTASDYLATSDYMNQKPIDSLGLIDKDLREKVILAAATSHSYNSEAYHLAISDYKVENPKDKSGDNLNLIRKNMAIELLRNIRNNTHLNLFYLEAPTGGGKTNLSMLAIAELLKEHEVINKVFYVFPFTTLITQTHKSILKTLNLTENEVSLLHSKAGFQSNEDPNFEEKADGKYGQEKKDFISNLFVHYPFCLLTHIRFFDILKTNEKETNYLFHRLANSIVVIDELQSYSPVHWDKILYFIQNYAKAFNVKFILMSATLPRIDKLNLPLENKPVFTDLLPNAKEYFTNPNFAERVKFRFDYRDATLEMPELAAIVIEKSEEYLTQNEENGVFTIIEFIFKKSATEFEEVIDNRFFDEILVLSGTILEPRRKEIINKLKNEKNRDKKILLITTQVVEAGVDIDMDLGFKNVSLIDSDEQLAGRVNRNVKKENCEVYLFQKDKPGILYKNDRRYSITRDNISKEKHEEILKTKDFEHLYNLVLERTNKINEMEGIEKFSTYHEYIERLDYQNIHDKFKLIDNRNLSIFVPLSIPISIEDEKGEPENIFSENELKYLVKNNVFPENGFLNGALVWDLYLKMNNNELIFKEYTDKAISRKTIGGIISKYTFSIFYTEKMKVALKGFSNPVKDFEDYLFLENYQLVYDYEKGLIESKIESSENCIL